ncbi:28419_t:CDS:2 [Gigaspora margarita]|uniref:28419_t:CDS:1 n=1 Tax=Gigaspora margarita TaxID=4874 RepID=A0ABN7VUG2_GIGMA|nr:28419_t:CDS:2 [Gigaspora margarita]
MKTIRKSRKAVNHDYNQRKKDKYKALEEESKSLKELENTLRQYIARLEGQVELLKEELTNVKAENRRFGPQLGQIYDFEAFGNGNPVGSVDDVILPTSI